MTTGATSTVPAVSKSLMGLLSGVTGVGGGLALTDYIQNGKIAWPAVILAIVGAAGTLFHSADVGKRFLAWLGSHHLDTTELASLSDRLDGLEQAVTSDLAASSGLSAAQLAQVKAVARQMLVELGFIKDPPSIVTPPVSGSGGSGGSGQ